jgi:hypothetical protein
MLNVPGVIRLSIREVPEDPAAPKTSESPEIGGLLVPDQLEADQLLLLVLPTYVSAPLAAMAPRIDTSMPAAAVVAAESSINFRRPRIV